LDSLEGIYATGNGFLSFNVIILTFQWKFKVLGINKLIPVLFMDFFPCDHQYVALVINDDKKAPFWHSQAEDR
jgi:hypothetical protein